ncbi:hypothetical protein BELL_0169g00060 [Botrytis elliptica]|uniref:Zn(2)-C6 fungal-type domain-containing protein n=2 Tax=Botrytis TaxID=33196 RepID=A0A4Z1JRS9_9HELO|nr:hypothetical protein BELL_0169g00060 [Botrytis elliptica]
MPEQPQPQPEMTEQSAKRYRAACDRCHSAKIRCSGGNPCIKCQKDSVSCRFSVRANLGKPKGSLNAKTIEKLRRLVDGSTTETEEVQHARSILALSRNGRLRSERSCSIGSTIVLAQSPESNGSETLNEITETAEKSPDPCNSRSFEDQSQRALDTSLHQQYPMLDMDFSITSDISMSDIMEQSLDDFLDPSLRHLLSPPATHSPIHNGINSDSLPLGHKNNQDRLEAFNSLAAACIRGPLTPTSSTLVSFENAGGSISLSQRNNDYPIHSSRPPTKSCRCMQNLIDCMGQLRAIEQRESPVGIEAKLHHSQNVLTTSLATLQCLSCSSDPQTLLLSSIIMTTMVHWADSLVSQREFAQFTVKYGEYTASDENSTIVKTVLTAGVLAKNTAIIDSFRERMESFKGEGHQAQYIKLQLDSLASLLSEARMRFNASNL